MADLQDGGANVCAAVEQRFLADRPEVAREEEAKVAVDESQHDGILVKGVFSTNHACFRRSKHFENDSVSQVRRRAWLRAYHLHVSFRSRHATNTPVELDCCPASACLTSYRSSSNDSPPAWSSCGWRTTRSISLARGKLVCQLAQEDAAARPAIDEDILA